MNVTNSINLLRSFLVDYLDGNIERIKDFDIARLRLDKVYGCPGRNFDPDDTNIMRAIYCVVFGDVWENLNLENCGDGKLRGDTLNSSATFFSYPWKDQFTPRWNPPTELKRKIDDFQVVFHTIGNMMILPDKRIGEWSINKHRGCHDEWHDYEDRFLSALYKVLLNHEDLDPDLKDLVELNNEDFRPFYGEEGWRRFVDGNFLNDYVDNCYNPVVKSKGYTWWRGGYTNRERFFEEANRYIDESSKIIYNRSMQMIKLLNEKIYD